MSFSINKGRRQYDRLVRATLQVQRELTRHGLRRRELMKLGVLAAGTGMLAPVPGLSLRAAMAASCPVIGKDIISPAVTPFRDPLQRAHELRPVPISGLTGPRPTPRPVPGTGDSRLRCLAEFPDLATATPFPDLAHQAWVDPASSVHAPPVDFYELNLVQHHHVWHSEMPAGSAGQFAWGFAPTGFDPGARPQSAAAPHIVPGPVIRGRYGRSHLLRVHNRLPDSGGLDRVGALGFGVPTTSTHVHNAHVGSESDGGPLYFNYPGGYWDHHFPNLYAGVNQGFRSPKLGVRGDYREALGSLWYHDHRLDFTAQNVYAGLFGFHLMYDEVDTGDETVAGTTGVRFPTHSQDAGAIPFEFDVPLIFHDRQFDADGVDFFPLVCLDGAIGDRCTVNGTIQPHMRVQPRRYRFRLYVGGPSRFMWIWLRRGLGTTDYLPMTVIASDGNLLPAAIEATSFKQSPGERFDVIVDFSNFRPGTELYLTNRAEQRGANGPTGKLLEPGASLDYLKFIVDPARAGLTDDSTAFRNGTLLRPLPPLPEVAGARRKEWVWGKSGSAWSAGGEFYDRYAPVYEIPGESTEVWTHKNGGGSWSHPIHAHFEESRLIGQKGTATPAPNLVLERGRKDTFRLDPSASVDLVTQFRDFRGIYPVHCHNNIHEDHGMMAMFRVV